MANDHNEQEAFCQRQLRGIERERRADVEQQAQLLHSLAPAALARRGLALLNLVAGSTRTGLGGRTLVELEGDPAVRNGNIDDSSFKAGDIVQIAEQISAQAAARQPKQQPKGQQENAVEGVVTRSGTRLTIAITGDEAVPNGRLWVVKLANEVTYKRMKQAIGRLGESSMPLVRVLLGQQQPSSLLDCPFQVIDATLNQSQQDAVQFALASPEIALIHGPPGTGKTFTLVELIRQYVQRGQKVLVCGPSNLSVDNLVERLAPHRIPLVRIGHPARLLPSVVQHSLDIVTRTSNAGEVVADLRREMDETLAKVSKTRSGRERRAIYDELKVLRKEFRVREAKAVSGIVMASQVVLATLHGAGSHHIFHQHFDVVVIDEASQALEAQCWIAALRAGRLVLAGDHLQLPPTIKSDSSSKGSLGTTLFDRLLSLYGDKIKRLLNVQYRMHEQIMRFPSDALYDGKLVASDSVACRRLCELPGVADTSEAEEPLVFYDTQGDDFFEAVEDEDDGVVIMESRRNEGEASIVSGYVRKLATAGVPLSDIAVITPYSAQVSLIKTRVEDLLPDLEVGTVDGFQGREKEAVVVSLVRSNAKREVGFLKEKRRLNVAMTRPKRHLCIIGDSETVRRGSSFLESWMDYLEDHADLRYPDPAEFS